MVEKQIKDFDIKLKQYKLDHPRVGFSQMKLNEAYDLSTTNGYMKRQVMKKTIPENPFEINLIKERCKNKT